MTTGKNPAIRISRVSAWDTGEIVSLYRAGGWWKESYDPADIPRLISGSFAFVVAVDVAGGRAVGMGRVISDGVSDAYIQDLIVLPEYRGMRIGQQMVRELLTACMEAKIPWIGLVAEPDSEPFYLPLGFRRMEDHVPLLYTGGS